MRRRSDRAFFTFLRASCTALTGSSPRPLPSAPAPSSSCSRAASRAAEARSVLRSSWYDMPLRSPDPAPPRLPWQMALHRGIDGAEPVRPDEEGRVVHQEHRVAPTGIVAFGTLACPQCDAPIAIGDERLKPRDLLLCPFCAHGAPARDFLSLEPPTRPTRVAIRVT